MQPERGSRNKKEILGGKINKFWKGHFKVHYQHIIEREKEMSYGIKRNSSPWQS